MNRVTLRRLLVSGLLLLAALIAALTASPFSPRVSARQEVSAPALSCAQDPTNLTINGSFNGSTYDDPTYGNIAAGWTPFSIGAHVPQFQRVTNEQAPGDPFGSQYFDLMLPFDAGIYQTISNTLTPATSYQFKIGYALAAQDPGVGQNRRVNVIGRQIGVDLTGGTDPRSATVVWSQVYYDGIAALNIPALSLTLAAQTSSATVFLRGINTEELGAGLNKVWFDVACAQLLDPQPSASPENVGQISRFVLQHPISSTQIFLPLVQSACAFAPTVSSIDVGAHSKGIAADPATNRVSVSLYDASSVTFVDPATNIPLATWWANDTGYGNGIGALNGKVFLATRDTGNVSVVNGLTGAFSAKRSVGTLPFGVGAANGKVWVANFGSDSVSVVDATTYAVTTTSLPAGSQPALVATASDRAFVSLFGSGVASLAHTGALLGNFNSTGVGSCGVAFNATTNRLYVGNRNTKQISILDPATGTVTQSVTLDQAPYALAINPATNRLFVVLADTNQVDVRDGASLDRIALLAVGAQGLDGGDGIAVLNGKVYVSNNAANTMSIISDECAP